MNVATGLSSGSSAPVQIRGGMYNIQVSGDFGGSTVAVEYGTDGANWYSETDSTFASPGAVNMELPGSGFYFLRGTVSGGSEVSIDIKAIG
ncbi:MAG: hypothetical protein JAY74_17955 [Candidatus Thiodiazotropha taylori]|nr:hypothetical protein [Candidatus Thiodiazotropha taylori]